MSDDGRGTPADEQAAARSRLVGVLRARAAVESRLLSVLRAKAAADASAARPRTVADGRVSARRDPSEPPAASTVGTGSAVAVGCTLATLVLIGLGILVIVATGWF